MSIDLTRLEDWKKTYRSLLLAGTGIDSVEFTEPSIERRAGSEGGVG